jgi:YesN/AraC family two-component response regulator
MNRILVVDDNVMMRKLIINLFREQNLEFEEASNGREGLGKIIENHYDLVITDILMPDMEGIEMIMLAKKHRPNMKIIAMSGGKPYYLYMAKKLGIEAVFTKPLNQHQFYETVGNILQCKFCRLSKAS